MIGLFHRTELIFGTRKMQNISEQKVIVFGIGGVGSWCTESLIRSGIIFLTIVDVDKICVTNINRQLQATTKTIGKIKVEVLKERLLEINPDAEITALQKIYNRNSAADFELEKFDYVIDAIDSLSSKVHLIYTASNLNVKFFSSMGSALKIDSSKIKTGFFSEVKGCPLSRLVRKRLKRYNYDYRDFFCVYSDEVLPNHNIEFDCKTVNCSCNKAENDDEGDDENIIHKAVTNGSLAHITAIFGFTLAGFVLKDIYDAE